MPAESGTDNKIKVVWLCHFANQELINRFDVTRVNEFAPWISLLIKLFEKHLDIIDLYIVAPNVYRNQTECIEINNVKYYLFDRSLPLIPRKVELLFSINHILDYCFNKKRVSKIINEIKPDIIHLHGAENAYYSATVLSLIKKYPVLVTIQGFIMHSSPRFFDFVRKKLIRVEKRVLKKASNFGIRAHFMEPTIRQINPLAKFYWHNYPINQPVTKKKFNIPDEFDCVYFARIHKDKGIEDLLLAISLVKEVKKDVKLVVIGSGRTTYLKYIHRLCVRLGIQENVIFMGFLKTQNEIYSLAIKARMSVLPTHHDIIPGTVLESMFLKLPVISYNVGGLPEINKNNRTNIVLVEKGDITELKRSILTFINNKQFSIDISNNGYSYAVNQYKNQNVIKDLLDVYIQITHSEHD